LSALTDNYCTILHGCYDKFTVKHITTSSVWLAVVKYSLSVDAAETSVHGSAGHRFWGRCDANVLSNTRVFSNNRNFSS